MRIQCLAMRRSRRPRLPGLSEAVAGKMSASDSSSCQTLRGHRKRYGWELFRGLDVCSTSLFTAYCQLLTANCLLVEGHEQPIRPGLFKRRLGLQTLEGRHLLRGKVLIVTRTVDLRERVVRPGVPGLDARSDLELAQRAFFVSQPPQGFPQ